MTQLQLQGRARVFGDDINTDYIITSRRKRESLDPQVLRQYLFEELDPQFAASLAPGDIIVAGKNFGCGSAMEVAVTALVAAGVRAIVASSFARTYFRNAINNGLLPLMCDTSLIREGDPLAIVQESGDKYIRVYNLRIGAVHRPDALPQIMLDILDAGGRVGYFRQHHDFVV